MAEQLAYIVYICLGLITFETIFFLFIVNKLLNKAMSRDFMEYQSGKKLLKKKEVVYQEGQPQENLGMIADFR